MRETQVDFPANASQPPREGAGEPPQGERQDQKDPKEQTVHTRHQSVGRRPQGSPPLLFEKKQGPERPRDEEPAEHPAIDGIQKDGHGDRHRKAGKTYGDLALPFPRPPPAYPADEVYAKAHGQKKKEKTKPQTRCGEQRARQVGHPYPHQSFFRRKKPPVRSFTLV